MGVGGHKKFPLFKGGGGREKFYPVLRGGGAQTVLDPQFSHFVAPPLPVINDQSLTDAWVPLVVNGFCDRSREFYQ